MLLPNILEDKELKEEILNKIAGLSEKEALQVLIFIFGLAEGQKISEQEMNSFKSERC